MGKITFTVMVFVFPRPAAAHSGCQHQRRVRSPRQAGQEKQGLFSKLKHPHYRSCSVKCSAELWVTMWWLNCLNSGVTVRSHDVRLHFLNSHQRRNYSLRKCKNVNGSDFFFRWQKKNNVLIQIWLRSTSLSELNTMKLFRTGRHVSESKHQTQVLVFWEAASNEYLVISVCKGEVTTLSSAL